MHLLSPKQVFRIVSVLEAITWSGLLLAMGLRYLAQQDVPFFFAVGLAHGFVFLGFVVVTVIVGLNQRWGLGRIALVALSALPPYVTIVADVLLERRGMLAGGWRTEATDDPRDAHPLDRFLRWWLARPWLLAAVVVLGVVGVTAALLVIGPPGG